MQQQAVYISTPETSPFALGRLDVYGTSLDGENDSTLNSGEPLNNKWDDLSYIINSEAKGYFASSGRVVKETMIFMVLPRQASY